VVVVAVVLMMMMELMIRRRRIENYDNGDSDDRGDVIMTVAIYNYGSV